MGSNFNQETWRAIKNGQRWKELSIIYRALHFLTFWNLQNNQINLKIPLESKGTNRKGKRRQYTFRGKLFDFEYEAWEYLYGFEKEQNGTFSLVSYGKA